MSYSRLERSFFFKPVKLWVEHNRLYISASNVYTIFIYDEYFTSHGYSCNSRFFHTYPGAIELSITSAS